MEQEKLIVKQAVHVLILVFLVLLLARPVLPVQAHTPVFVSPSGAGTDCTQANPCSLVVGLTIVDDGGTLYAAAGIYTGSGDAVVTLSRTINFYGGWNGATSGPLLRDPGTYISTLDGGNARRVIAVKGDATVEPVIDGWTIQNGNASTASADPNCQTFSGAGYGCGGGIYVLSTQPEITNNVIRDNTASITASGSGAGGGIYIRGSDGTLVQRNRIYRNDSHIDAQGQGGGIAIINSGGKTSILDNEIFSNEDSSTFYMDHRGAGLYVQSSAIQIHGNNIYDNDPNAEGYSGAGIFVYSCLNTLWIDGNTIVNNHGENVLVLAYSLGTIQQNTIINPGVYEGIRMGGDYSSSTDAAIIQNNIVAQHSGNNIYISGFSGIIAHAHLYHNTLSEGATGLFVEFDADVTFDRGIVSDQRTAGIFITDDTEISLAVTNTLFHGNVSDGVTGTNPLSGDPLYVNPTGGNYHIQWGSAAIDRVSDGGVAEDIDGDDRPMGTGGTSYDVGADEYWWKLFLPEIIKP